MKNNLSVEVLSSKESAKIYDFNKVIFDLDDQLDMLSSKADTVDYIVSAASGLLCGLLDILWVGDFDIAQGRAFASDKCDKFVQKTAHMLGCKSEDMKGCVKFLEDKFPIPADGNAPDFGGGLQHHLRDFAHHPTIVGLAFSLLTQFTKKSYGTNVTGQFVIVDVPQRSKIFIGKDVPSKIIYGTLIWFFHLVSDLAGSSNTAGISGGTGIPGPILSLAKELSALPVFNSKDGNNVSVFLSKLFNGTLLADHDENGKIIKDSVIKMDFRGELGALAEIGKQAIPVIANECIIRVFYFVRRLLTEIKKNHVRKLDDLKSLDWRKVLPINSPTLTRMLTISSGVFTAVDIADAVITEKYFVAINYVGVTRFAIAIGGEIAWGLKRKDIKALRDMYEKIQENTFTASDEYQGRLGLTLEQIEILYNIEYYKTKNDIETFKLPVGQEQIKELKGEWLDEWSDYMEKGFEEFTNVKGAILHWYSEEELLERIWMHKPNKIWYKLVLLEAMLFTPYFPLNTETDKKGREIPSTKYKKLISSFTKYNVNHGDKYLESVFSGQYCPNGFIARLRKCYGKVNRDLNEFVKNTVTAVSIGAAAVIIAVITAGTLAPEIAVALVGSNFAGLSGAALTNACLAYLGGGAIAAGGAGMAGGTIAIVGGGAILGVGAGVGAGGISAAAGVGGKKATILQSAKLMVTIREIILNEEHDVEFASALYDQYVESVKLLETSLIDLRLEANVAQEKTKKNLKTKVKNEAESAKAMEIAMNRIYKYISSYQMDI